MRTFEQMLIDTAAGPGEWHSIQTYPKPPMPHFARTKGAEHHTLCEDTWLNKEIFGRDYEWADIANPPAHTIKILEIWKLEASMNEWMSARRILDGKG